MVFLIYLIRIFRLIGMTLDEFQTRLLLLLLVLLSLCDSRLLLFIDYHDWFFSRWGHLCRVFDHDYRVSLLRTFNHLWRRRRLHKYFDRYSFFIFSLCTTFILLNHVYVYFVYWSDVLHGLVNDFRLATLRLERWLLRLIVIITFIIILLLKLLVLAWRVSAVHPQTLSSRLSSFDYLNLWVSAGNFRLHLFRFTLLEFFFIQIHLSLRSLLLLACLSLAVQVRLLCLDVLTI